jgi:hypothetical protein
LQITELKGSLDESVTSTPESAFTSSDIAASDLFIEQDRPIQKQDLIDAVPPREISDQLIATTFNNLEIGRGKTFIVRLGQYSADNSSGLARTNFSKRGRSSKLATHGCGIVLSVVSMKDSGTVLKIPLSCGSVFSLAYYAWVFNLDRL